MKKKDNKKVTLDYDEYERMKETIIKQKDLLKDLVIKNKIVFLDERMGSIYTPGLSYCPNTIPLIRGNLDDLYKIYSDSLNEASNKIENMGFELTKSYEEIKRLKNLKWYERTS